MDFESYLKENAQKIDQELSQILSGFLNEVKEINPKLIPLVKAFIKSCQGGKRIRGALCKLGFELASAKCILRLVRQSSPQVRSGQEVQSAKWNKEILKIGAAVEILHTAILIHDDIIDQSPIRRDQPSLYKAVGESLALTLGDLGFFLAIKIIVESNFPEIEKNNAVKLVSKTMVDTTLGQIMDIKKDDPLLTARLKTARYTISGPLKLGAILAGADQKLLKQLEEFGENLGIAFQIQDDILDGESSTTGFTLTRAKEYALEAKKVIPKITYDKVMRELLEGMCRYLVERTM